MSSVPGEPGQADVRAVLGQVGAVRSADDQELGAGYPGQRPEQGLQRGPLVQVGGGEQPRPAVPLRHRALGGKGVGVDAPRDDPDRGPVHAQAGQVRGLGRVGGDHGGGAAPDGGLQPDPRGRGTVGPDPAAPFGDPERAELLYDGYVQVTGGGQGGQPARPAQRVHDVRALALPAAAQRAAEGGHPLQQAGVACSVAVGQDRPGIDVRDPHSVVQLGLIGQVRLMLLGEYGHLVTMRRELTGELAKSVVIAVWSGTGARAQRRRVLSYQGDLHLGGLLADESQSRCRQRKRKSGTSSARPAKTPCRVERACVVGTTCEKHIPLREFSNNPIRRTSFPQLSQLRRPPRCRRPGSGGRRWSAAGSWPPRPAGTPGRGRRPAGPVTGLPAAARARPRSP